MPKHASPYLAALLLLLAVPAGPALAQDSTQPDYDAGLAAGMAAYRETSSGVGAGPVVLGIAGGAMVGSAMPLLVTSPGAVLHLVPRLGGGVGLILLGAGMGAEEPPARLVEPARATGIEYGAGFIDGYREASLSERRGAAWRSAALGFGVTTVYYILLFRGFH